MAQIIFRHAGKEYPFDITIDPDAESSAGDDLDEFLYAIEHSKRLPATFVDDLGNRYKRYLSTRR